MNVRTMAGTAAVLIVGALVAGCGDDSTGGSTAATPQHQVAAHVADAPQIELAVAAPADGSTVRTSNVTVRGTVTPAEAAVQVLGKPARVRDGVFQARARL